MTVRHFIIKGFLYVWQYVRKPLIFLYDKIFYTDFPCAIADILSVKKTEITAGLFITASRLLDLQRYEKYNDTSFPYQIAIRAFANPTKREEQQLKTSFANLIHVVEKDGFQQISRIYVDNAIYLFDGTHRLGILLQKGVMEIPVRCVRRKAIFSRKIDVRCKSKIPPQMLEDILQECTRMQQTFLERGYSFVLWISGGEESEIRHLLFGLTPFIDVYKTYAVASNATQYDGGFLVQFTPKNLEYAVTRKGYYAKNVKRMESILSKRIANLGWNQRFAISQNCLEGHKMMETVQAFLKEVE